MRYISRSGYETYTSCERKYYWQQLWRGTGFETPVREEYYVIGIALHEGLEVLSRAVKDAYDKSILGPADLRELLMAYAAPALSRIEESWHFEMGRAYEMANDPEIPDHHLAAQLNEWLHLVKAMFLGWLRVRALGFFTLYEVLLIEEEIPYVLTTGLTLSTRSDLVVRDRQTGNLFVVNWKTTGSKSNFFEGFNRSVQMWTEALAVQRHLKESIAGTLIEGFYKGSKRRGSYSSPLLWGYQRNEIWSAKYVAGWDKIGMWKKGYELPNGDWGLPAWINWLPTKIVDEQFLQCPPIPINEGAVEGWLPQVVQRETDLEHMMEIADEKDRLQYFFQRFGKNCNWCPYDTICQGLTTAEAMVESGVLVERRDHHAPKA